LQARLSEDILVRRERSAFFRTKPGYFFLREFLADQSIPIEYRIPIIARRRRRELAYSQALAFSKDAVKHWNTSVLTIEPILDSLHKQQFHYAESSGARSPEDVLVWSFVLVLRNDFLLTYRHGRYRENRDAFLQKRSIGFFCPVVHDDLTLFDQADHGVVECGVRALAIDLNLSIDASFSQNAKLKGFVCASQGNSLDLLGLVAFQAPEWFEPFTRRLAINDLAWHDTRVRLNHYEDFDPWSRLILEHFSKFVGPKEFDASAGPTS
jgi:hypothetical protein